MTSSAISRPASPDPAAPRPASPDPSARARRGVEDGDLPPGLRVVVLADDLIWSTRLVETLTALGAAPLPIRSLDRLAGANASHAVVDLTARAYDGVAAVRAATGLGLLVLAVGQHDDAAMRKAALGAGAERVLAYRKLFEDGPGTLGRWLAATTAP